MFLLEFENNLFHRTMLLILPWEEFTLQGTLIGFYLFQTDPDQSDL